MSLTTGESGSNPTSEILFGKCAFLALAKQHLFVSYEGNLAGLPALNSGKGHRMAKKSLNSKDYDKLINTFAEKLWLVRELWLGIKEMKKQSQELPAVISQYPTFFACVYRSLVHDLYNGIFRLLDETKEAESLLKLLKKLSKNKPEIQNQEWLKELVVLEKELVRMLENDPTIKKITEYRHNVICHQNSQLIFDAKHSEEFYKKNNPSTNEIEVLLDSFGEILKKAALRASFSPLTSPETPIRSEIGEVFNKLANDLWSSSEGTSNIPIAATKD